MNSTWNMKFAFLIIFCVSKLITDSSAIEPGIKHYKINKNKGNELYWIRKSLYKDTHVILTAKCLNEDNFKDDCTINLEWVLRVSDCDNAFIDDDQFNKSNVLHHPEEFILSNEVIFRYQKSKGNETETCNHKTIFQDQTVLAPIKCYTTLKNVEFCKVISTNDGKDNSKTDKQNEEKNSESDKKKTRLKREDQSGKEQSQVTTPKPISKPKNIEGQPPSKKVTTTKPTTKSVTTTKPTTKSKTDDTKSTSSAKSKKVENLPQNRITKTWQDGRYIFIAQITLNNCKEPDIEVTVEFVNKHGYLSATDRPLLTFYAVMCAAYTILAFLWLLMMACQWRDILRLQFWICGVVMLGLLEKVVFYAEYHHLNTTGYASPARLIFAELVSCLKRTVARMLIIIVSMGFGITKPRLGPQLHRVIGVGFLYFVLSAIEACMRVQGTMQQQLVSSIPLAVLDAVICYWIFTNLVDTTRTLRLRRNVVKLWLYRHFTNALIFCILAAIAFLTFSLKEHKLAPCITRWREIWLDDAYWHILFYIVLIVIIILWRPTANNQRYSYSPLTDALDDEESKEPMIPEAFEGMKMRSVKSNDSAPTKVEDDLKWVEDNIPASVADAALAVFDDSDEEIVTNIERSKME